MDLRDFQAANAPTINDSLSRFAAVPSFTPMGGSTMGIATPRLQAEAQRIRRAVQNNVFTPVAQAVTDPYYAATPGQDQRRQDARKRILEKVAQATTDPMVGGVTPTKLKLYRGDSVNLDGIGKGSHGDLGTGHYLVDEPHAASYFTDGSDPSHVRAFHVDTGDVFDLMNRNMKDHPKVKQMVNDLPDGLNKTLVQKWFNNNLDVKDPYSFLANATGNTPETFNQTLAQYGFGAVSDQGVRGISEGSRQYVVFAPSQLTHVADK